MVPPILKLVSERKINLKATTTEAGENKGTSFMMQRSFVMQFIIIKIKIM